MQDIQRAVLAVLHFVPDHRHFGIQILLQHGHIDHAGGFQLQRPTQVLVARVEGLVVHRLVVASGAVEVAPTAVGEFLEEFPARLGGLEHHVFQQVGHAGLAVAFIARANLVDHIDGGLGLGVIGEQ